MTEERKPYDVTEEPPQQINGEAEILLSLLAEDKNGILYRPKFVQAVGSVTSAILLQQAIYWWVTQDRRPFYKFKLPCGHALYREGDSWCEELGFSRHEFDTALRRAGTKKTAEMTLAQAFNAGTPIVYWTTANRVTYYTLNLPVLLEIIKRAYLKPDSGFSKSRKVDLAKAGIRLYQKPESGDRITETTQRSPETTTENLPAPAGAENSPVSEKSLEGNALASQPESRASQEDLTPQEDLGATPQEDSRDEVENLGPEEEESPTGPESSPDSRQSRSSGEDRLAALRAKFGTDPLSVAATCARAREAAGDLAGWTVPGHEGFDGAPLAAFCRLAGMPRHTLPEKKAAQFVVELRKVAEEWGLKAGDLATCIDWLSESKFNFKAYSTPYQHSFKDDVGVMASRLLDGKLPPRRGGGGNGRKRQGGREGTWSDEELRKARWRALAMPPLDVLYDLEHHSQYLDLSEGEKKERLASARPRLLAWARALEGEAAMALEAAGGAEAVVAAVLEGEKGV